MNFSISLVPLDIIVGTELSRKTSVYFFMTKRPSISKSKSLDSGFILYVKQLSDDSRESSPRSAFYVLLKIWRHKSKCPESSCPSFDAPASFLLKKKISSLCPLYRTSSEAVLPLRLNFTGFGAKNECVHWRPCSVEYSKKENMPSSRQLRA